MKISSEYLKAIKPKISNECDKYSWNIYRYLKEHQNSTITICWYEKNFLNSSHLKFNKEKSLANIQTYILIGGINENLCGARIYDLQIKGNSSRLETFSFCLYGQENFADITDWFLTNYQQKGRCIFDLTHTGWWSNDETRFTQINKKSRRCNWCGEYQRKVIVKKVVIKRQVNWEVQREVKIQPQPAEKITS